LSAAGAIFVTVASVPAFVLGVLAGRHWQSGAVGTAVFLAFGIPIAAWSIALLAERGGEGLGELAIIGGSISVACSVLGAVWTVSREAWRRGD
jgi:hypothetical protein